MVPLPRVLNYSRTLHTERACLSLSTGQITHINDSQPSGPPERITSTVSAFSDYPTRALDPSDSE